MTTASTKSSNTLKNQVALVTGSSSGIGRAIAAAFAQAGADVLVHGCKNRSGAKKTAAIVKKCGQRAQVVMADVATTAGRAAIFDAANEFGDVSILVNNAGADVLTGEAANWSFEEKFEQCWRVDVLGGMAIARHFGAAMQAAGTGSIVTIGWDQAETGMAGDSGEMFAATKGAVMAFTRSLAKSLAPSVRVNCIAPGWIRTAWGDDASEYWQDRAKAESLRNRWGNPEDIAQAACFLASPAADFINGVVLPVNGGFQGGFVDDTRES